MPPFPALPTGEVDHQRRVNRKEKDDELALFADMQTLERQNFLIHCSDDIESTLYVKLGGDAAGNGEDSELLNVEGDENDYDWLLTPPETPLFPSLDEEDEKPSINSAQKNRPSQPISIPRASTMERSCRGGRISASPQRLSPSPRPSGSSYLSHGKLSVSHSPGPILRANSPAKGHSTSNNQSSVTPRSTTPNARRMSTGSSVTPSSIKRNGASLAKPTRGGTGSPKLQAWQGIPPGVSVDPSPNFRTLVTDRPASHVRGPSPPSTGKNVSNSKTRRQSMSPTASRSVSSSHTFDPDRFSSHSKGSATSSGDDDMNSSQSVNVMMPTNSVDQKTGSYSKTINAGFSKKSTRPLSVGSAPKRSLDFSTRQLDNHKGSQQMFRTLLSSVPSTTFYPGKDNPTLFPSVSRNSYVTTSINVSSEKCAFDDVVREHEQDDLNSGWVRRPNLENRGEEIFTKDKADEEKVIASDEGDNASEQHGEPRESLPSEAGVTKFEVEHGNRLALHCCDKLSETVFNSSPVNCSVCLRELQKPVSDYDDSYIWPSFSSIGKALDSLKTNFTRDTICSAGPECMNSQEHHADELSSSKSEAEFLGISILLQKSSSTKWPVVQGRTLTASTISSDNFPYVRDNLNIRSCSLKGGVSPSSSVDLGSYAQHAIVGKKEMENMKEDLRRIQLRGQSSASGFCQSCCEDSVYSEEMPESVGAKEQDHLTDVFCASALSNPSETMHLMDSLVTRGIQASDEANESEISVGLLAAAESYVEMENSRKDESHADNRSGHGFDDPRDVLFYTIMNETGELRENSEAGVHSNAYTVASQHSENMTCVLEQPLPSTTTNYDDPLSSSKSDVTDQSNDFNGKATVTMEGAPGHRARSLTLDEATDAILFCSSIVQNLVHEATSIATEKERSAIPVKMYEANTALQSARFTLKNSGSLRKPKAAKTKRKRTESSIKLPPLKMENDVHNQCSFGGDGAISFQQDTMEPPKPESKCNCTIM